MTSSVCLTVHASLTASTSTTRCATSTASTTPRFSEWTLERLGAPELAAKFLGWYVEYAGDPAPPSLLHHYLAYRAYVRAKVACLRAVQGETAAVAEAREHADLAHRHLATAAVTLVLVGGLPGTGKSTLAGAPR